MVQKIVINKCYGGFSISNEAVEWIREEGYECGNDFVLPGEEYDDGSVRDNAFSDCHGFDIPGDSEGLVAAVEEFGGGASGRLAQLKVVEIPDGVEWDIGDYDGMETVEEKHRTWG